MKRSTLRLTSDETIRGAPRVEVACSNVKFKETDDKSLTKELRAGRRQVKTSSTVSVDLSPIGWATTHRTMRSTSRPRLMCGSENEYEKSPSQSLSRPRQQLGLRMAKRAQQTMMLAT